MSNNKEDHSCQEMHEVSQLEPRSVNVSSNVTVSKSVLSPYAEEFVPRKSMPDPRAQQQGPSQKVSEVNTDRVCVSDRLKHRHKLWNDNNFGQCKSGVVATSKLIRLVDHLELDESMMDTLVRDIPDIVKGGVGDPTFIERSSRALLSIAVLNTNFHPTFARLCDVLDKYIPGFYAYLLIHCKNYFKLYKKNTTFLKKVISLSSVMSEILINIHVTKQSAKTQLKPFVQQTFEMMKFLITEPHDREHTCKVVCQQLKLAGFFMQLICPDAMQELMKTLEAYAGSSNNSSIKYNINYILEIAEKWRR